MESPWLLIVLFFLIILVFPMFFKLYFSYSPLKNSGLIVIRLWVFNISYFSFQLKANSIILRSKKERKQIEYKFDDPLLKFYDYFYAQIKQKIKIKYLDIYSEIGTGDAYSSAILSSAMSIFYKIFCSYIKNVKYSTNIITNTKTTFNEKVLLFSIYGNFSISFFDIVFGMFIAFFYNEK